MSAESTLQTVGETQMAQFDAVATRQAARTAMAEVKLILKERGLNEAALESMKEVLVQLTLRDGLFPADVFCPMEHGRNQNILYCLAEDPDGTNALYLSSERHLEDRSTLPHNHLTWAVIVGVEGKELNKLYERTDDGSVPGKGAVRQTSEVELSRGKGICLMPEEIHSVHAKGGNTMLSMHVYGLSMPRQTERIEFLADGTTRNRKPNTNIRPIPGL